MIGKNFQIKIVLIFSILLIVIISGCTSDEKEKTQQSDKHGPNGYYKQKIGDTDLLLKGHVGEETIIVIPVEFDDFSHTVSREDVQKRVFSDEKGSVNSYFKEVSYGKFYLKGDVIPWVRAPKQKNYYGEDTNRGCELIQDAIKVADKQINYSKYQHVFVVFAGDSESTSQNPSDIWAVRCSFGGAYKSDDSVDIFGGALAQELGEKGVVGTWTHELGHDLGLPDLYDYGESKREFLGKWDLMASGGHNSVDRVVRTNGNIISVSDPDASAREQALLYLYSIGIDTDDDGIPDTFDPSKVELPKLDCEYDQDCHDRFGPEYICSQSLCESTEFIKIEEAVHYCRSDADCKEGLGYECNSFVCAPPGLEKIKPISCGTIRDCPSLSECIEGSCIPVPPGKNIKCKADINCPGTDICREGICGYKDICSKNSDCEPPLFCYQGACALKTCNTNSDCIAPTVCSEGICDLANNIGTKVFPEPIVPDWATSVVVPSHLGAWSKLRIGWIGPKQIAAMNKKGSGTVTLTPLSENSEGLKAVKIPLDKTAYYLVEVRVNTLENNDKSLPDSGVLISLVDETKESGDGPVRAVNADPSDPTLNKATFDIREGKQDTFTDNENGIEIRILDKTDNNYKLGITRTG